MSELLADLLITVLFGTQASFTHPGIILPAKESLGDLELKTIVRKSQRNKADREVLGYSLRVWRAMTETLRSGNEQLLENKHHLLSKIADLTSLGRNLLVAKEKAQDLCAEEGFEAEIRKLIEICVEKATKPISPNLEKGHHEKEMKVKQAYKRVLITSLQFLNNLITSNETRKLHLWMHLFGSPTANRDNGDFDDPDDPDDLAVEDINLNPTPVPPKSSVNSSKSAGKQPQKTTEQASNQEEGEDDEDDEDDEEEEDEEDEEEVTSLSSSVYSGFASLSSSFNYSYYNPGLLTNIPPILGPSEIEALPMIIQNGIAPLEGTDKDMQSVRCNILLAQESGRALLRELLAFLGAWEVEERDFCYKMMQSITEAILLNGLAPFAYEAFKDDKDIITPAQCILLKLLVSIYRSPGYNASDPPKTSKTIPSMTLIPLRLRGHSLISSKYMFSSTPTSGSTSTKTSTKSPQTTSSSTTTPKPSAGPQILDTSIAAYLIRVFRTDVLPNIRNIILQQGAIKSGEMKRETFEWSLWDLDRVYEGLFQFMEMMVCFADDEESKKIMLEGVKEAVTKMKFKDDWDSDSENEIVYHNPLIKGSGGVNSNKPKEKTKGDKEEPEETGGLVGELVGFLVEMDRIIPRYLQTKPKQPQSQAQTQAAAYYPHPPPPPPSTSSTVTTSQANLVERPYDPIPPPPPPPPLPSQAYSSLHHPFYRPPTPPPPPPPPLPSSTTTNNTSNTPPHPRSPSPAASSTSSLDPDSTLTDPEDFTWPHMKKYCVILLSNLSWKNNDVKDLVREKGGLAAVMNQCMVDDDNPYIREYAILCVRNLLEGNQRNQKVVGGLERRARKEAERLDREEEEEKERERVEKEKEKEKERERAEKEKEKEKGKGRGKGKGKG